MYKEAKIIELRIDQDREKQGIYAEEEKQKDWLQLSAAPSPSASCVNSQIDTAELDRLSDESADPPPRRYYGRVSFLSEIQDADESVNTSQVQRLLD